MSIKASGKTKSYCKKKRAKVTSSETSALHLPQTPRNILREPHARCLVWKLQHLKHQQFQQQHQVLQQCQVLQTVSAVLRNGLKGLLVENKLKLMNILGWWDLLRRDREKCSVGLP